MSHQGNAKEMVQNNYMRMAKILDHEIDVIANDRLVLFHHVVVCP